MSTRPALLVAVVCLASLVTASTGCAQSPDSLRDRGHDLLNGGQYAEARAVFRDLLDALPNDDAALQYAETFRLAGEYEAGIAEIGELIARADTTYRLHQARGRLLADVGRYDEAEQHFREALNQKRDLWTAGVDIAELLSRTGRDRQARSAYGAVYQQYASGTYRTVPTLTAAGRAAAEVGRFRDANEAYRTAYQVDGQDVANLYAWAELFRSKYNDADARRTYEEALSVNPRHAPSLVGLALASGNYERKEELAQEALAVNPNFVPALNLLSSLRIIDGLYAEAEELAQRALDVNPSSVPAMAQLASAHHMRGDSAAFASVERRALQVDPEAAEFFLDVAQNASLRFRYPDAVVFAERAVDLDRTHLGARAELGTALLRLGRREEARHHLEAAFDGDPYNLFASNMLTLLDSYEDFALMESEHFELLIHQDERDVLGAGMLAVAETAFDSLSSRYPYEPADKIRIEAYGNADDFAVRIAGVPHRGLLGVSFGDVVAVNTPRAQTGQPYNWARTLWHELAHTMAIGVSDFRVPRWFTEGLSVYEEKRGRPEWAREMDLAFFSALERDLLLPLEEIDRGFTRPSFPGQIQLSYYHAGLVVEHIAETHGFGAVVEILEGLRAGRDDADAVRHATGLDLADVDRQFRAGLQDRARRAREALQGLPDVLASEEAEVTTESVSSAEGPYFTRLREGAERLEADDFEAAERAYQEALSMYESYVGPRNPYDGLAAVYRATGDTQALIDILHRYLRLAEHETEAALELADLYEERNELHEAASALERTLYVTPYDPDVQRRLGDTYERAGELEKAVPHRRAVLALNPPDRAGAYFDLARALHGVQRTAEAKRAVLQALEVAPDFRDAQKLLLEIVE